MFPDRRGWILFPGQLEIAAQFVMRLQFGEEEVRQSTADFRLAEIQRVYVAATDVTQIRGGRFCLEAF